jgi:hypothetical protein
MIIYATHQKKSMKYMDHFDFHLIAPARICKPLLISAFLFLFLSIVAFYKKFYLLSFVALFVYITSNVYWSFPVIQSLTRTVDIFASVSLLSVGTYMSFQLQKEAKYIWCFTLFFVSLLYIYNHFVYKTRVTNPDQILLKLLEERKTLSLDVTSFCYKKEYEEVCNTHDIIGKELLCKLDFFTYAFVPHITWPNTEARENAYKNGMIIHMLFVHVIPNILGLFCIFYFERITS